jgi:hypothetical protein
MKRNKTKISRIKHTHTRTYARTQKHTHTKKQQLKVGTKRPLTHTPLKPVSSMKMSNLQARGSALGI